jgi:hypothetical protein
MDLLQCFKRINMHSIEISRAMIVDWYQKIQIPIVEGDEAVAAALLAADEEAKRLKNSANQGKQ